MIIPKYDEGFCPQGYIVAKDGEYEGLLVRPSFLLLSADERKGICNGIGAASGLSKHFPNTIWGLDCKAAGDVHDYDYHIGGGAGDKLIADQVFLHNCRTIIRKRGYWFLRWPRDDRARAYYIALRLCGSSHFNYTNGENDSDSINLEFTEGETSETSDMEGEA